MPLRPTFTGGIAIFIALTGAAHSEVSPLDLVEPVADYKIFVSERLEKLVVDAKAFTDAIKAGNLDKAKSLYGPARVNYETIEPIAELFNELDNNSESRADDNDMWSRHTSAPASARIATHAFSREESETRVEKIASGSSSIRVNRRR